MIAFNDATGIVLNAVLPNENVIQGNEIEYNGGDGIFVGSNDNTIGGEANSTDPGNIIGGNLRNGIDISGGNTNIVEGNSIGVDESDDKFANVLNGIVLESDAWGNWIGMADGGSIGSYPYGNIISGNGQDGVLLTTPSEQGINAMNFVEGNLIGIGSDGTTQVANGSNGVEINQVIGTVVYGNVISGNTGNGVQITGNTANGTVIATQTAVTNNYIGTNAAGTAAVGNGANGIYLYLADQNTIGGATQGTQSNPIPNNVISGNSEYGIEIGSSSNLVVNNYIGTDVTGSVAIGNGYGGVNIGTIGAPGGLSGFPPLTVTAANNTIGGSGGLNSTLNVISGNNGLNGGNGDGISLYGSGVTGTLIQGNYIGVSASGFQPLGNENSGISIGSANGPVGNSPTNTTIGGTVTEDTNVIVANGTKFSSSENTLGYGVAAPDADPGGLLEWNYIGYDLFGDFLPNQGGGVSLGNGWTSKFNEIQPPS